MGKASGITTDTLAIARADGLSQTELAAQMGVTSSCIRKWEKAIGVRLPRKPSGTGRSHRDVVRDMKPLEAVEYLLEVIESMRRVTADDWVFSGVHFTASERRLLRAIAEAAPRVLTRDGAMDALMEPRAGDDAPEAKIIDVHICKIRRKLRGQPVRIVTHWGLGWTIETGPGFRWPWESAA